MATSIGGGLAEGLESGFRLGLDADAAAERKRATAQDEALRRNADNRAATDLKIRQDREARLEQRQGLRENLDLLDRQEKVVRGRQNEIVGLSTAAQTANQPIPMDLAKEYGQNAEMLAKIRQQSLDFFSRAQTGQVDPLSVPPAELYTNLVAATGMPLAELKNVPKYTADVEAGLQTGNQGLLVQGVNGLFAPQLRRGVGSPSPHGGMITRKEIIGLDPAVDADHNPLPGKFMPRLRVYVKTDGGGEKYYDAPMTKDGSADGDDEVAVIDVKNAMNWMGNLGTLAATLQRPDFAARVEQGEKEAGDKTKRYLDELTAISRPKKKTTTREKVDLGDRVLDREIDDQGKVVSEKEIKKGAVPRVFNPSTGASGSRGALQLRLDALEEDHDNGEITDDEYREGRKALLTGIKPPTTKGPTARDVADDERAAVNAVAQKLGLTYDANAKDFRNADGTAPTAAQKEKLGVARTAITTAARDAASKGKRADATTLGAAGDSATPKKVVKFGDLK
jgi:hypothetical protein